MDTITRNVDELTTPDRVALEHVLGRTLEEDQQVLIAVVRKGDSALARVTARARLLQTLERTSGHAAAMGVTAQAADDAVDAAMASVRPRSSRS